MSLPDRSSTGRGAPASPSDTPPVSGENEPSSAALAVMRAARPAQEAADSRFGAYSVHDAAIDLDRQVAKVRGAAIRAASMRTGVEAHARPFRVLVDVGHEEWADYTDTWEATDGR